MEHQVLAFQDERSDYQVQIKKLRTKLDIFQEKETR